MNTSHLMQEYLGKAQQAEEHAARCTDTVMKESWLGIALSYRQMAQAYLDGQTAGATAEQPSQVAAAKAEKSEDGL